MRYLLIIALIFPVFVGCSCTTNNNQIWEQQINDRPWHQEREMMIDSINKAYLESLIVRSLYKQEGN